MTIETNSSEEFKQARADAAARGQRITALKRGKGNASWILTLAEQQARPMELPLNFGEFAETKRPG